MRYEISATGDVIEEGTNNIISFERPEPVDLRKIDYTEAHNRVIKHLEEGMTQCEIAKLYGVSQSLICAIKYNRRERKKRGAPAGNQRNKKFSDEYIAEALAYFDQNECSMEKVSQLFGISRAHMVRLIHDAGLLDFRYHDKGRKVWVR